MIIGWYVQMFIKERLCLNRTLIVAQKIKGGGVVTADYKEIDLL